MMMYVFLTILMVQFGLMFTLAGRENKEELEQELGGFISFLIVLMVLSFLLMLIGL